MEQWLVDGQWAGARVDRFLSAMCPEVASGMWKRVFRNRDVKINGRRMSRETLLAAGDHVIAYIPGSPSVQDKAAAQTGSTPASAAAVSPSTGLTTASAATVSPSTGLTTASAAAVSPSTGLTAATLPTAAVPARPTIAPPVFVPDIVYEDEALLVVVKPQGMAVQQPRARQASGRAKAFAVQCAAGADLPYDTRLQTWWKSDHPDTPDGYPALCHRLDRNTGGLLMLAKTEDALRAVEAHLRAHRIRKFYRCFVAGKPQPPEATVDAWLEKDAHAGRVFIHEHPKPDALPIRTRYRTLAATDAISLLEVEIITGRTHQIRAQLARIGVPILGDSRYGSNAVNRRHRVSRQLLWACALSFDAASEGCLSHLAGKTLTCAIPEGSLPKVAADLLAHLPPTDAGIRPK